MIGNRVMFSLLSLLFLVALAACSTAEAGVEPGVVDRAGEQLAGIVAGDPSAPNAVQDSGDTAVAFDDDCAYGIGFWKNHPELWAGQTLTVGAQTYTTEEMLSILNTPPHGDASYILAQQLIAAKLNQTDDQTINEAIADADAWLAAHPLDSDPPAETRQEGLILAEYLDDYNNGLYDPQECPNRIDDDNLIGDDVDEFDDDDEIDDEDGERDDEGRAGACTGADPHPHGMALADDYGVSYEEIMGWFCQGYGFGEIELAYLLSEEVGLTVDEVFALRAEGMGWGNVRKELGAAPGLGNDKPGRGNDRDRDTPPGLEKKDDDRTPPGLEKQNNATNGSHMPSGLAKKSADSRGN